MKKLMHCRSRMSKEILTEGQESVVCTIASAGSAYLLSSHTALRGEMLLWVDTTLNLDILSQVFLKASSLSYGQSHREPTVSRRLRFGATMILKDLMVQQNCCSWCVSGSIKENGLRVDKLTFYKYPNDLESERNQHERIVRYTRCLHMPKPLKELAKEHTVILEQKRSPEKIHPEEYDVTEVLEQGWIEKEIQDHLGGDHDPD